MAIPSRLVRSFCVPHSSSNTGRTWWRTFHATGWCAIPYLWMMDNMLSGKPPSPNFSSHVFSSIIYSSHAWGGITPGTTATPFRLTPDHWLNTEIHTAFWLRDWQWLCIDFAVPQHRSILLVHKRFCHLRSLSCVNYLLDLCNAFVQSSAGLSLNTSIGQAGKHICE